MGSSGGRFGETMTIGARWDESVRTGEADAGGCAAVGARDGDEGRPVELLEERDERRFCCSGAVEFKEPPAPALLPFESRTDGRLEFCCWGTGPRRPNPRPLFTGANST